MTFAVTEMQPAPPMARWPSAEGSSPDKLYELFPFADLGRVLGDALHVAGRVLDADDVRQAREPGHGRRLQVHYSPAWHVIEDHRHGDGVVDRLEVGVQSVLIGVVVVRADDERGVGAGGLGVADKVDRLVGGVGAGTRNDGHAACSNLYTKRDDLPCALRC
jgi:hypothetical protein